jgi:hypothetical protein
MGTLLRTGLCSRLQSVALLVPPLLLRFEESEAAPWRPCAACRFSPSPKIKAATERSQLRVGASG